ncbi:MAG: flagellar filament capping protein FliD, partial [Oscillospiraceae bacterium]
VIGVKNGATNVVSLNMSLKDINFTEQLQGSQYAFNINGVNFSFNENQTLGAVIDKINNSNAGVEIKYSGVEDKFTIATKQTGSGQKIEISQGMGNLMTALFGDDAAKQVMSGPIDVYGGKYETTATDSTQTLELISKQGGSFKINVNGKDYSLRLGAKFSNEEPYTLDEVVDELNSQLKSYFGTEADGKTAKMSFTLDADKKLTLDYEKGTAVTFYEGTAETEVSAMLGLKNKEVAATDVKLTGVGFAVNDTININGTDVTISETTTLQDLIDKVGADNLTYDAKSRTLIVKGDTTQISSSNSKAMGNLFGTKDINFNTASGTDITASVTDGKNAKFTVITEDGTVVDMEKNTNNFTIDGLSITLKKATAKGDKPIEITTTRNTEQILDGIVKFVNDYNETLEKLNELTAEDPSYKKYTPLTDAQKEKMSESEIKLWEEKSKEGLLRGDGIIGDLLSEMRSVLYVKPTDAKFALYDIGISASADYKDNGKLIIKEDVLRNAIENNASDLQNLFAGNDGIAKQFGNTLDKYIKSSVTAPGRLVERAGIKSGYSETKNVLSRQIADIEKGLKNLEHRYEIERTRYWKQFSAMEQIVQQMNSQSSWLSNQFA